MTAIIPAPTMRERLAAAFLAELDRQGVYQSVNPEPPMKARGDTFENFIIDGHLAGWKLIDALLTELREPDEAMTTAWIDAIEQFYLGDGRYEAGESMAKAGARAMIDTVRGSEK